MSESTTASRVLEPGATLAGSWTILEVVDPGGPLPSALARGREGSVRALCTPLGAEQPDPELDEEQARFWGAPRCVLRDEDWGRVVVDELPEGATLAEWIEEGRPMGGVLGEINRRVREAHRRGWAHGSLVPRRVVVGDDGIVLAGWGLREGDLGDRVDRDVAALAELQGRAASPEPGAPPAEETADAQALRAAIMSDSIPALEGALADWEAAGGDPQADDARRASDALARLRRRVEERLGQARRLLDQGDTLGAVAACRDAIRLGAEDEAAPLLESARRAAKRQLGGGRRMPPPRVLVPAIVGAIALILLFFAAILGLREPPEASQLRERVELVSRQEGLRAAASFLVDLRASGAAPPNVGALLEDTVAGLVEEERERLLRLRNAVVARGARPLEAESAADAALGSLSRVVEQGAAAPTFDVELSNALAEIDRAAALYRAATAVGASDAEAAVEGLLASDPVFGTVEEEGR